jgi:hypothetical protein
MVRNKFGVSFPNISSRCFAVGIQNLSLQIVQPKAFTRNYIA